MEITPRELRDTEIHEAFRGYNRDEVNEMLERAAATIETLNERLRELNEKVTSGESDIPRNRETEDILHRTLLLAQRAADEAVAEAQEKARQMVEEAEQQSRTMLSDAEQRTRTLVTDAENEAHRRGEAERIKVEQEAAQLASRRDALLADVDALVRFETDYRERMVRALEADLSALRLRPSASPGPEPQLSEPQLSEPVTDHGGHADPFAGTDGGPQSWSPAAPAAPAAADEADTRSVDVRALFGSEASAPAAPPAPQDAAPPIAEAAAPIADATAEPFADSTNEEQGEPSEMGDDVIEAEALDDDAFFATLREAVHDDTPLGPREEDDDRFDFFGDEGDRSSFRDVFRRRR
jgi:cell division initiation protein